MTDRTVVIERDIAATPAEVWKVLADFPNIADWNTGVRTSRSTGTQTVGVGASRHCDLAPAGTLDETITGWEEGRRLAITIDKATVVPISRGGITFLLDTSGDMVTPTTVEYRYAPKGGPLGRFVGPLLDRQLAKGFAGFLADLEAAAR